MRLKRRARLGHTKPKREEAQKKSTVGAHKTPKEKRHRKQDWQHLSRKLGICVL